MSKVVEITADNFKTVVKESSRPVLVDFWAPWCGPCRKVGPIVDEVAAEMGEEAVVGKVNVDEERSLGTAFQIMSIPTIMIFKDGKVQKQFTGVRSKTDLLKALREHI